ncbi:MAG TPA: hypothetical protein PKY51_07045 [Fimbriimonadaceae bacterium]|nr:hypothetical protein [Fimbriimonadaceae bacterium]
MTLLDLNPRGGTAARISRTPPGMREFGVPPGGPFDVESASLAQFLAENAAEELWECSGQVELISAIPRRIGFAGAVVRLESSRFGPRVSPAGRISLDPNESLRFGQAGAGARFYLAIQSAQETGPPRFVDLPPGPEGEIVLRFTYHNGPSPLNGHSGRVHQTSRQGLRVQSSLGPHSQELPSEPAGVGAVQWTPSGELLILGPDGPTLGGYPKVGGVVSVDLPRVAQLRAGDSVRWQQVTIEQAILLRQHAKEHSRRFLLSLQQALRQERP